MAREMTNAEQKIVKEVFQDIVDDYQLDYGNGEITFENYNDLENYKDLWIDAVIEAPNNSVISVPIDGSDYDALFHNEQLEDKITIRGIFASEIYKAIEEWDAEETFKELWSCDFEYDPFTFVDMLREDEDYFDDVEDKIVKEAI